jgi:hypothetical protein
MQFKQNGFNREAIFWEMAAVPGFEPARELPTPTGFFMPCQAPALPINDRLRHLAPTRVRTATEQSIHYELAHQEKLLFWRAHRQQFL